MVIAFPCAVGIGVLASPIMQLLFGDGGKEIELMLRIGAVSIVFYSLSTLTNALLQGSKPDAGTGKNALIALVLHIIVLLVCMYGLNLGIYSVVIANAFFCTLYVYFEQTLAQKVHKIPSGGWKDIYRTGNFLGDHGCRSIFCL